MEYYAITIDEWSKIQYNMAEEYSYRLKRIESMILCDFQKGVIL